MTFDVRKIDEELAACDLSFREQCKIVYDGLKKGVRHDGCTGVPDGNFALCCAEHDTHYQLRDISRAEADERLRLCMLKKGIPSKIGPFAYNSNWLASTAYYVGVRVLGWKFYGSKRLQQPADVGEQTGRDLSR